MRKAILTRGISTDAGTFGELVTDSGFKCVTGELPWRGNTHRQSCIPERTYICRWRYSEKHGRDCYHVDGVSGRDGVEIHSANLMGDIAKVNPATGRKYKAQLLGCIAPGLSLGELEGQRAVVESVAALRALEADLAGEDFELTIV